MRLGKLFAKTPSSKFFCLLACLLSIILLNACAGVPSSETPSNPPTSDPGNSPSGNTGSGTPSAATPTLQGITVSPASASVDVGATQQMSATGKFSDGSQKDMTQSVSWQSSNAAVAAIDAKGLLTGVSAGSVTITATSGPVSGTASATVTAVSTSNGVNVLTWHNDNARTGANTQETTLTLDNVNPKSFGKLFKLDTPGDIQAQPLYVSNLTINGQTHNVVFVATQNDVLYAFDADKGTLLWQHSFVDPSNGVTIPVAPVCCPNNPGITGTPVIDINSNTMYLVVRTSENGKQVQRLHAVDITTGNIKNSVVINPSVPGTGDKNYLSVPGTSATTIVFNNATENQRPGLLLANGLVWVMYASHSDKHPYHGWVLGYDAGTLNPVVTWNATPNGQGGGIWMSGASPAADSTGNIYFATGNGDFGPDDHNYAQAWIKMSGRGDILSFFAPYNWDDLNGPDLDVASGGGSLIPPDQPGPNPHLLVSVDKNGTIYLLDRDNMGGFHQGDNSNVIQTICNAFPGRTNCATLRDGKDNHLIRSSPAYWNGLVYFAGQNDVVKAFQLANGKLSTSPVSQGPTIIGFPGATVSISSNGTGGACSATANANNGIVWLIDNGNNGTPGHSTLRAYNACDLSKELYNSRMNSARDDTGTSFVRFVVPTIANGKVFVPSNGRVSVYGLLGGS